MWNAIKGAIFVEDGLAAKPAATPLIAPLKDAEAIAHTVQSWLCTVDYGPEPDHDGDNSKGFCASNKGPNIYGADAPTWKRCEWEFYTFLMVQPLWIEYGK